MRVIVYCVPASNLIREKTCDFSNRCRTWEVIAKIAMNRTNITIEDGVTAVLLISNSLKFIKYSTNSITSDGFISSSSFSYAHHLAGLYSWGRKTRKKR